MTHSANAVQASNERLMAAQMRALELSMTGAPLPAVLYAIVCGVREQLGDFTHPAILIVDTDGSRLHFGAAAGMAAEYVHAVEGFPIGPRQPSCASVAFTNKASFVADVTRDPLWAPYLDIARTVGIRSCWSIPIRSPGEKPLGTLAVYQNNPALPDESTVHTLNLFAQTAALIIERSNAAAARDKAEQALLEAHRALRESEQQFAQLAESMPQLVWIADANGNRVWFNRRWYEYTGTSLADVRGSGWHSVHDPRSLPHVVATVERSVASGQPFELTVSLRSRDGTYRWFLTRAVPVRNAEGQVVRWFGTCTDISDLRDTEEALRRAESIAATGRMAHAMAHEINNPLEAITNIMYLLANNASLPPRERELVDIAQRELDRVAHITKRTFHLYGDNKATTATDLCALMDKLLNTFSQRIAAKGISVRRSYRWNTPVDLLENSMAEALWNVLDNAVEVAPANGSILVRVRGWSRRGQSEASGVCVTIADNGPGIPRAQQETLFEPFSSTKEQKGTGLGLWILRNVVVRHGGNVRIRSTTRPQRHGTCCAIFLPVGRAATSHAGKS